MLRRLGNIRLLHAAACAGALSIPALSPSGSVAFGGITAAAPPTLLIARPLVHAGSRPSDPIAAPQPPESGSGTERNGAVGDEDLDEDLIVFDPPTIDFGEVLVGTTASREFWILNASESPITIDSTRSTCGCTIAHLPAETIDAGDAIRAVVRLTVPKRPSPIRKQLSFSFADDPRPRILRVHAEAVAPVIAEPGIILEDQLDRTEIRLRSFTDQPFRILQSVPPVIEVTDREQAILHQVRISQSRWLEHRRPTIIRIFTDHPGVTETLIRIRPMRPDGQELSDDISPSPTEPLVATRVEPVRLRLSTNRVVLGRVTAAAPGQFSIRIDGIVDPEVTPYIRFSSLLAEVDLLKVRHDERGTILDLILRPAPGKTGHVRSDLAISIHGATAYCSVFASIRPNQQEPHMGSARP